MLMPWMVYVRPYRVWQNASIEAIVRNIILNLSYTRVSIVQTADLVEGNFL